MKRFWNWKIMLDYRKREQHHLMDTDFVTVDVRVLNWRVNSCRFKFVSNLSLESFFIAYVNYAGLFMYLYCNACMLEV